MIVGVRAAIAESMTSSPADLVWDGDADADEEDEEVEVDVVAGTEVGVGKA